MKRTAKKEEERRIVRIREGREQEMELELHSIIHSYRRCGTVDNCLTHWRKMNCAMAAGAYHRMVVPYRRFGTTYRSHLQGSSSPSTVLRCIKSQKSADLIYIVTEDWSHKHVNWLFEVMKCLSCSSFRRRSNFSSPGAFFNCCCCCYCCQCPEFSIDETSLYWLKRRKWGFELHPSGLQ